MVIKKIIQGLSIAVVMVCCTNPFTTRSGEKPAIDQNSDIFDQPTSCEDVLSNLRYALIQKNVSNYMSCFIDTSLVQSFVYRFKPDESFTSERFQGWSLTDEENYFRNVFTEATSVSFEYVDAKNITFTPISAAIDSVQTSPFVYELQVQLDSLASFSGIARMKLVKNSNSLWAIYYWEDMRNAESNPNTWSLLKAIHRFN
jgi:hypothetical protein